jgi:hypothetical protein
MPAAPLAIPERDPNPASKARFVKLRQKTSAGNRPGLFVALEASFLGSPGMIVGDDTRTFPSGPPNRVPAFRHDARSTPGRPPADARQNGATRRGWRQLPARHDPRRRGQRPRRPNDALRASPAMIIRMRLRAGAAIPGRLEHASAVPTIAGHGAQRGVHNPAAEAHATSTRRSDGQKPCSGRNLDQESPTIIHGAGLFVGAGTCEEVAKTCGGSARSRTVPGRLELALGQGEQVKSRSKRFALRRVSGVSKPQRQRTEPGRHPTRSAQERSVAAQPVAVTARAGHTSRPRPNTDTGSPTIAARLAPVADSCANSEIAARRARRSVLARLFAIGLSAVLHSAQNSRGTRKERGHDQHRATVF